MPSSSKVLVLGAGELGMAVLRALSVRAGQAGAVVSVLLRPATIASAAPEKVRDLDELAALGVTIESADVAAASVGELAAVFGRFDTVISCVGFAAGKGTQLKLTQAALQAGVKRYLPWQFGVDYDAIGRGGPQDLFDEQLDVRDLLRGQRRTEWVIVSTGMFTSFLFEPSFGVVSVSPPVVHALGGWDTAVTVTTPDDIGLLTADIVFAEPRFMDEVVYLAGDTLTYGQLADLVERVLGRTVQRVAWTVPELKAALAEQPDDTMRKYRAVFALGTGVAWDKTASFNARSGVETVTAEQWARAHLVASGAR